ncbi:hypothetical protein MMC16_003282 [Acarospora aff. strigata]|nr:hypothetical protein [Acarospora aff. strigata]
MAGAAKKRAQKDRQAQRSSPESSSNAQSSGPPGGFDGPGERSDNPSGGGSRPPQSPGGPPSHSRHSSNVPGGYGPPAGEPSSRPGSFQGPPSGTAKAYAPMKVGDVNRRLDLPGNAYNLGSEVSSLSLTLFKLLAWVSAFNRSFEFWLFIPSSYVLQITKAP